MKVEIIAVGKVREKYIKQGIAEFKKRLQPYCTLALTDVRGEHAPDYLSEKELERVINTEGERILQRLHPNAYVIALDVQGKQKSSEELAKKIEQISFQGKNNITFIIGGANGLSQKVLSRANERLSFSKMTFPHQLMKLILLEQVYRAYKIQRGEPYHK